MFSRRLKTGYFILEGLNSFALVYYQYYLFFFTRKTFGFDNKANLALAALNGLIYALCAWWGGKFAQRFGYFSALKLGFVAMIGALSAGLVSHSAFGQVLVMAGTVLGMCFTWPALEALVSEGEPAGGVQHMVGVYNIVWAGTGALAYFSGGMMLDKLGLQSMFYVPVAVQLSQLGLTFWLEAQARRSVLLNVAANHVHLQAADHSNRMEAKPSFPDARTGFSSLGAKKRAGTALIPVTAPLQAGPVAAPLVQSGQPGPSLLAAAPELASPKAAVATSFVRMAWLANPFAYIAINTAVAVMPSVAERLKLSTMLAGFCCSVWCFARLGAFVGLWLWSGWHYRFRWLFLAYVALVGSFTAILLAPNLTVLVLAQLLFGGAIGLIYYSSLFYSMDQSETKGEHGGIHEAAIGLGNFAGPAVGAAALQFLPGYANSGALAVTALLLCGLGGLTALWRSGKSR